jgi:hypothetical protein
MPHLRATSLIPLIHASFPPQSGITFASPMLHEFLNTVQRCVTRASSMPHFCRKSVLFTPYLAQGCIAYASFLALGRRKISKKRLKGA